MFMKFHELKLYVQYKVFVLNLESSTLSDEINYSMKQLCWAYVLMSTLLRIYASMIFYIIRTTYHDILLSIESNTSAGSGSDYSVSWATNDYRISRQTQDDESVPRLLYQLS